MSKIIFPKLKFDKPGVYRYTIKELTPSDEKWKTDKRIFRVVVTVTQGKDGKLAASIDYPDGRPVFVNKYCNPECCCYCCCKCCCCQYCCCTCCKCCCCERREYRGDC